ncbi:MAG: GNAT family N-acetyltransferase [Ruminococcaceae bacterium]|nr:GNAT family N-acetyltransferase [Oscillospiraceae bacterium]
MFSKIPEMETDRLLFRAIRRSDIEDVYEYSANPKTSEFLLWEPHNSIEYTKKFIDIVLSKYKLGEYNDWAIVLKENNKMIGTCGFTRIDEYNSIAEIGYVLNPKYWGYGIATEAAKKVVDFAFEVLKVNRVEAKFMFGNEASLRVMNKIGMKFEGYQREAMLVKGKYRTIGISSILKREYLLIDRYN